MLWYGKILAWFESMVNYTSHDVILSRNVMLYILNSDGVNSGNGGSTLPVASEVELYYSCCVLEGLAIVVVTQISSDTCLSPWIRERKRSPIRNIINRDDEGMGSLITSSGGGADGETEKEGEQQQNSLWCWCKYTSCIWYVCRWFMN